MGRKSQLILAGYSALINQFDMPDSVMEKLIGFSRQNNGSISKRARSNEFRELRDDEVAMVEKEYKTLFINPD